MDTFLPPESDFYSMPTTRAIIEEIINAAHAKDICDATCYHLVGALLAIRFGEFNIAHGKYDHSAASIGTDYWLDDTAFHVAVQLTDAQLKSIYFNLEVEVVRAYLLVPEFQLLVAREKVSNLGLKNRISVESIESFIGTLLDAMSCYNLKWTPKFGPPYLC